MTPLPLDLDALRRTWQQDASRHLADHEGIVAVCDVCLLSQRVLALLDRLGAAEQARDEAKKTLAITSLSTPMEEDLYGRINEMCRYLSMEQGYTLSGIGRLLVDCQRRMADDWMVIGRERDSRKAAEADRATLTQEIARLTADVTHWQVILGEAVNRERARADAAERERDAIADAVHPKRHEKPETWDFASLATLASAHREDTDTMDDTAHEVEAGYGRTEMDWDVDKARLLRRQRLEAAESALVIAREQQARLEAQARDISLWLAEAGIGPCPIPEGVKQLLQRSEAIERAAIAATLDNVIAEFDNFTQRTISASLAEDVEPFRHRIAALRPVAPAPPSETP